MNICETIKDHGKDKVRAVIELRPLHVYCGMIALTSSNDTAIPVLCEVDEKRYKVDDGYKIGWKPIAPYGPQDQGLALHKINGFASETFYQSDFNSLVNDGRIKVYIEA